ncbi:low temperature requirement protein A [Micromonospora tulbaghiae]|uniref:low temperature requirement protein A n=1 Tax=Micromonospora tulbaghiae TaxID=479978 RepID=UPI0033ABCD40
MWREMAESALGTELSGDHGWVERGSEGRLESILRGEEDSRQANFLELFFDLVLVFALIAVTHRVVVDLSSQSATLRWLALLHGLVLALPMLWLWTTTAEITSRFDPRHRWIQLMILVSAFGLHFMSTSVPDMFGGRGAGFAVPYVLLQVGRPLLLVPQLRGNKAVQASYARRSVWSAVSAVFWIGGVLVRGEYRVAVWLVGIAVDLLGARLGWPVPGMRKSAGRAWVVAGSSNLPDRYQQLLFLAVGETVLAAGLVYAVQPVTLAATAGLVVAFLSTVLLWRIYFYRAGKVFADAISMSTDSAAVARVGGAAHVLLVLGVVGMAAGSEIVQKHPGGHTQPAWLAVILGGPALYLIGRLRLEHVVYNRISPRRLVGIGLLLLLALPLAFSSPLVAATAATAVLFGIAVADARQAAGRPLEAPTPPHKSN